MKSCRLCFGIAAVLVAVSLSVPALADSITDLGKIYTLNYSNQVIGATTTTIDITLTIDSAGFNGFGSAFTGVGDLTDTAIKVVTGSSSVIDSATLLAAPGGVANWMTFVGDESGNGCSSGHADFVCSEANFGSEADADLGGTLTFEWALTVNNGDIAFGTLGSHVKARFGCEDGTAENCHAKPATSQDITLQPVPEPASLVLLGSALIGATALVRKRFGGRAG